MGEGLGRSLIAYLDTSVAAWLAQGSLDRISPHAQVFIREMRDSLLISPIVLLELEYLHEIGRIVISARDIQLKLEYELRVRVCELAFAAVIDMSLQEKWTRDPFDRIIVAQAKANGLSHLVSADGEIRAHYPRAVW